MGSSDTANRPGPVLYLPHGGGPLPLLGDPRHASLVGFLQRIAQRLGRPSAILVVSAHWEEAEPALTAGSRPGMIYDYAGFPPAAYQIDYPAPGEPRLAAEVAALLEAAGFSPRLDVQRGFDHGLYVPLKLMYPQADIPCIQLSLLKGLDPRRHIALGRAIAALRDRDILIVGSGMSFHNMRSFFARETDHRVENHAFDRWLVETSSADGLPDAQRERRLVRWEEAPYARFCHPREEHLLPLHVCYGVASAQTPRAEVVFNDDLMGRRVTSLLW
jgi:aromatic ring-opening dioxygenase catalytic subunit (LigB family)